MTRNLLDAFAAGVDVGGLTRDLYTQLYERLGGAQCEGGLFKRLNGAAREQYALPCCVGSAAQVRADFVQIGRLICKVYICLWLCIKMINEHTHIQRQWLKKRSRYDN